MWSIIGISLYRHLLTSLRHCRINISSFFFGTTSSIFAMRRKYTKHGLNGFLLSISSHSLFISLWKHTGQKFTPNLLLNQDESIIFSEQSEHTGIFPPPLQYGLFFSNPYVDISKWYRFQNLSSDNRKNLTSTKPPQNQRSHCFAVKNGSIPIVSMISK